MQTEVESDEDHEVQYVGLGDAFNKETNWDSRSCDSPVDEDEEEEFEVRNHPIYKHKPGGPQMEPVISMKFCIPDDLKNCLRSYVVAHEYPINLKGMRVKGCLLYVLMGVHGGYGLLTCKLRIHFKLSHINQFINALGTSSLN